MKMKKQPTLHVPLATISEFSISGLHGEKNLKLKFSRGAKIVVADNGSGKTTLLNALYSILEGNFLRLAWVEFTEIKLVFKSGIEVVIPKSEIPNPMEWLKAEHPFLDELRRILPPINFKEIALLVEKSNDEDEFRENTSMSVRRSFVSVPYSTLHVYRQLREIRGQYMARPLHGESLRRKWKIIKSQFPFSVIFMPTYRRVEEDIRTLGLSSRLRNNRQVEERHIFFGMADVRETFEQVTSEIRNSTSETFRAVSSKVIDQLLEGGISSPEKLDISRLKDQEAIGLVLKRLGKQLPVDRLAQLNGFIKNPQDVDSDGRMLLYLLNNFFGIYESQIENDRKIKSFIVVANKYLVNKELKYDEVNIRIGVFSTITSEQIDLERLSSGEKQLVSILARLYLSGQEKFAIIIDEPELSLSIDWQRSLLPDLIRSEKCMFLLAATHSPFIFDNELEKHTSPVFVEATK